MRRPYWLTDAKIEHGVYLGFTRGQWPIQAFSADNASMAARWAAEAPNDRVILGPVFIPAAVPTYTGKTIPAETVLVEDAP